MVQQTGLNELPIQKRIAMNITMQTFHFYKNIFTINVNVQVFIIIIFLFFFSGNYLGSFLEVQTKKHHI